MIDIVETYIEDIRPRYRGDRIREHIIPGTFPRRVTEIATYEDNDPVSCRCVACRADFTMLAKTYARLAYRQGRMYCWRCYNRRRDARHERATLEYISGQRPFLA